MKGIGCREFIDFVEESIGPEVVDEMIDACDLESGGAYTAVGTYDYREMLALLNNILDLSKSESGRVELESIPFDLRRLIDEVKDLFTPSAVEADLRFEVCVGEDVPRYVVSDSIRLRQVLTNLLSNAVKFTHEGCVTIRLDASDVTAGEATLHISVEDTGIGIAAGSLEKIFDDFAQSDSSMTRRYGGTGLGLAICRRIVELRGGELVVESEEGQGTVFRFATRVEIPEESPEERARLKGSALGLTRARVEDGAPIRVLLAEDNNVNRLLATRILEKLGCVVETAANGAQVLDILSEKSGFDVVLMDCQMPLLDGFETTRRIRDREGKDERIPIIALTAHAMKGDRERCIEAGMDDHLTKPIILDDLRAVLERCR